MVSGYNGYNGLVILMVSGYNGLVLLVQTRWMVVDGSLLPFLLVMLVSYVNGQFFRWHWLYDN